MSFITNLFTGTPSKEPKEESSSLHLLVIDGGETSWADLLQSSGVIVHQGGWDSISVACYSNSYSELQCMVSLTRGTDGRGTTLSMNKEMFKVDLVLIREECRGASPTNDSRNVLYGFQFANVPCINSVRSTLMFLERPVVFGELNSIRARVGQSKFPLIEQNFYSTSQEMLVTPPAPVVLKMGHAHAGAGKIRLLNHKQVEDFRSVVVMTPYYCTAEPFVSATHDLRIQRIGNRTRVYSRVGVSGSWKTNTGACIIEQVEALPRYVEWADQVQTMFGGLDIFALDVLVEEETGEEFILEVNPSSIGLAPDCKEEDNLAIAAIVKEKLVTLSSK